MDTYKLLNELESLLENSKPFFNNTLHLDREVALDLTSKAKAALPDDMKRADRVTRESEQIVDNARERAENTLDSAAADADKIMREARATAERLLRDAEAQANKLTLGAEAKAKQVLEESRLKSEKMLTDAHQKSEKMVNQSEVVRIATVQARELIASAEREIYDLRRDADEYAHGVLIDLERNIGDLMGTIQRGRIQLDKRLASGSGQNGPTGMTQNEMAGTRR